MAIFMLCGQVMATPFIVCRDMLLLSIAEVAQDAAPTMAHDCAGMMMAANDSGHDDESTEIDEAALADQGQPPVETMQQCEYLCQFGRSISSFDPTESLIFFSAFLAREGDLYTSRFVSPPIEVHFRPPINA